MGLGLGAAKCPQFSPSFFNSPTSPALQISLGLRSTVPTRRLTHQRHQQTPLQALRAGTKPPPEDTEAPSCIAFRCPVLLLLDLRWTVFSSLTGLPESSSHGDQEPPWLPSLGNTLVLPSFYGTPLPQAETVVFLHLPPYKLTMQAPTKSCWHGWVWPVRVSDEQPFPQHPQVRESFHGILECFWSH